MATQAPPGIQSDYRVLREGAGILGRAGGVIEVRGPDAVEFLQGQVTNDVAALAPGDGAFVLLLNPKGRILAEMRVLMRSPQQFWVHTEQDEEVLSNFTTYKIGRQVDVSHRPMAVLSLIGPRVRELIALERPEREHAWVESEINEVRVVVVTTNVGVDVILDGPASRVEDHFGEQGGLPVTEQAAEIVRIESGRPRYGIDMTAENLPGELGLEERAISFTKGCYVGQEPVARMHYKGRPNRHLRGLRLSRPVVAGQALGREGKQVGAVTSACLSPALGPIALALVRREVEPGERLALLGEKGEATVVELPFEGA